MIRLPFFYGYVIIGLCFLNMSLMRGILASFSVLYVAFLEEFQWSHATAATIASVNALAYGASSPLVGWSYDRLGPRILMPVGGALIGTGLILSSLSSSLWQFYLFYGLLMGLGLGGLGFVSNSALLSHWFQERRATAMGFATMGLGVGILVVVPTVQLLITRFGWRTTLVLAGGTVLAVIVPLNALLQRRRPEDLGQLPDGAARVRDSGGAAPRSNAAAPGDWTLMSAMATVPFWSIATGHLALGTGLSLMYTHVVANLIHAGLDTLAAASLFGLVGLARIPGTAVWGYASDRLDRDRAYGLGTLITLGGIAILIALGPGTAMVWFYLFVILYGVGHSAGNPTFGATIADTFGGKKVGTIFGVLEITFGLGMGFGPWFGGFVYDVTGSYTYAFLLAMICFLVAYGSILVSMIWRRQREEKWRIVVSG